MLVALDEGPGPPIRYQYAELGKLYSVVSQLVRCCDVSSRMRSSVPVSITFYSLRSSVITYFRSPVYCFHLMLIVLYVIASAHCFCPKWAIGRVYSRVRHCEAFMSFKIRFTRYDFVSPTLSDHTRFTTASWNENKLLHCNIFFLLQVGVSLWKKSPRHSKLKNQNRVSRYTYDLRLHAVGRQIVACLGGPFV